MRKKLLYTIVALWLGFCPAAAQLLSPGVSLELAQQRAGLISQTDYQLAFVVPAELSQPVTGSATVSFCLQRRHDVVLDFQGRLLAEALVNGRRAALTCEDEHIVVPRQLLRKGANSVTLQFQSTDQALNRHEDYLYTLFVPDHARSAFPCFDQPDLKATFRLDLKLPDGWTFLSSDEDHKLPTYLFSFTAGKFKKVEAGRDGRQLTLLHREDDPQKVGQLSTVFDQIALSLRWLEAYTGIPYPFSRYAAVVLPGYQFGGMEHPGAIQLNAKTIFLPPTPTPDEEMNRLKLIAHETAHMWFGDLVTMRWFNDVWTKEVFANLMAAKIAEEQFPELNHDLNFLKTYQVLALKTDRTGGTHPIQQPLANLNQAGLLYGNIIYDKAPVMMRKLEELMGADAFRSGLQRYLRRFAYANATWDDLIAVLSDVAPQAGLQQFSEAWVKQRGLPTIEAWWRNGRVYVRQTDPFGRGLVWQQRVKVGLETLRGMRVVEVDVRDSLTSVPFGERVRRVIPNYDGRGYGRFLSAPPDSLLVGGDTHRYALMMTLYENYLMGQLPATRTLDVLLQCLQRERNPLIASTCCSYVASVVGCLDEGRPDYERRLLDMACTHPLTSVRQQLLRALGRSALAPEVLDSLYNIWQRQDHPLLSETDYTQMSYHLAIMFPRRWQHIVNSQRSRLQNADRQREYDYVSRACNPSPAVQDSLFSSLADRQSRVVEPWAAGMLALLNTRSREPRNNRYITPALELLPEIQRTGGIFFPANWLSALLGAHRSPEAKQLVDDFLERHSELSPALRNKVFEQRFYMNQTF
ncbi:MAG: aminopeptidase [Prevotella sp.]|nr:aminopeptidase [Prevotella sp.]